jgi:hypothetical protein
MALALWWCCPFHGELNWTHWPVASSSSLFPILPISYAAGARRSHSSHSLKSSQPAVLFGRFQKCSSLDILRFLKFEVIRRHRRTGRRKKSEVETNQPFQIEERSFIIQVSGFMFFTILWWLRNNLSCVWCIINSDVGVIWRATSSSH